MNTCIRRDSLVFLLINGGSKDPMARLTTALGCPPSVLEPDVYVFDAIDAMKL